jgi:hypothetical protein
VRSRRIIRACPHIRSTWQESHSLAVSHWCGSSWKFTFPIYWLRSQSHRNRLYGKRGPAPQRARPFLCQIQRAPAGLYVGWLEIGNDHWKAGGERRLKRPDALTIRHASLARLFVPTALRCCPSAARWRKLTPRAAGDSMASRHAAILLELVTRWVPQRSHGSGGTARVESPT